MSFARYKASLAKSTRDFASKASPAPSISVPNGSHYLTCTRPAAKPRSNGSLPFETRHQPALLACPAVSVAKHCSNSQPTTATRKSWRTTAPDERSRSGHSFLIGGATLKPINRYIKMQSRPLSTSRPELHFKCPIFLANHPSVASSTAPTRTASDPRTVYSSGAHQSGWYRFHPSAGATRAPSAA